MRSKIFAAICILLVFNACAKRIPVIELGSGQFSSEKLNEIKSVLDLRRDGITTLKALYYTTLIHAEQRERFRQVFLFEAPDKLRVETLPTTSTYSLGFIVASGDKGQFVDSQSGEIRNYDSVKELIYDTLRYSAGPEEVVRALLGTAPPDYEAYISSNNEYQLYSKSENYIALLDSKDYLLKRAQFLDKQNDRVMMQIEYQDYKTFSEMTVPSLIKITLPRESVNIELKLNYFQSNAAIPAKNFEFLSR